MRDIEKKSQCGCTLSEYSLPSRVELHEPNEQIIVLDTKKMTLNEVLEAQEKLNEALKRILGS